MMWVKSCLDSWTQRVVISCMNSSWQPASTGIPQGSILAPIPFDIAINGLCNEAEHTLSKLADDTKRTGAVNNIPEVKAVQSGCNRLENCTHKTLVQFNTSMCIVLYLGQNNPMQDYMANRLKSCFAKNCLGVLVNEELNTN